jgi:hypothetical protein
MTYRFKNPELYQEEDRVPVAPVAIGTLVTLVISAALTIWAVSALFSFEANLRPSGAFPETWIGFRRTVARVREDVFGERRGPGLIASERAELRSYGWVDRDARVVHIPIDRAIEILVGRGQP